MNAPERHDAADACPAPETVVAFAMDGGGSNGARAVGDHIAQCAACRHLVAETAGIRDLLRMDADLPIRDLTDDIMARLPADAWAAPTPPRGLRIHWQGLLRVAAALAFLLGAAYLLHRQNGPGKAISDPTGLALQAGQDWLIEHQTPTGGWDAATLDGRPVYAEALNGLAIMAIIRTDTTHGAGTKALLSRAADFLFARQSADGRISRDAGAAMYNHGIATLALLEIDRLAGDTRLGAPIDKALAYICRHQSPAGGWGYRDIPDSPPNTSITAWQVKALLQARAQGRDVPVAVLRKALNWMAGTVGPQGHFGYEGPQPQADNPAVLTLMGAHCILAARDADLMTDPQLETSVKTVVRQLAQQPPTDYHQAYFIASVIEQVGTPVPDTQSLRQTLLARQIHAGSEAGCWQTAGDRWSPTGGKLYTTAMAMLALAPPAHRSDGGAGTITVSRRSDSASTP